MNFGNLQDPTPIPAEPALQAPALRSRRSSRRWLPVTALVGGVVGTGIFLASTTAAFADDGGGATSSSTASTSAPAPTSAAAAPDASVTPPAPPTDGSAPTPPTDGNAPTPPAPPTDGSAPTPPADGTAPTLPAGPGPGAAGPGAAGPAAPAPVADGSTRVLGVVAASSDSGITVQTDDGQSVSATFSADTKFRAEPPAPGNTGTPTATTAADLTLGSRVEIRVLNGTIVEAGKVVAHVDGTLVSLNGASGTVVTRDGLKVGVDLSGVTSTAVAGDEVHVRGAVDSAGTTIKATSVDTPPAR